MQNLTNGQKATHSIVVRVTKQQHERLIALSEMNGFTTVSQYVRDKILESPLVEKRLTEILTLLQENKFRRASGEQIGK